MRVVVTGGRTYQYASRVSAALDAIHAVTPITALAHGGAYGADAMAEGWGEAAGVEVVSYAADWVRYGLAAGPMRNRWMLGDFRPDLVVAFPGGPGTAHCVREARKMGIPVQEVAR